MSDRFRAFLNRHRFLSRWTGRRTFAVVVLATLALALIGNLDPRLRAGILYVRPASRWTIPVAGVTRQSIRSSWHEARDGGGAHRHEGCDILAPRGTEVVAATDGVIWAMNRNELGGNVVYVLGSGLNVYYYAHLDSWAPGIAPGDTVKAGDALGAVGDSGDAKGGPTHLHFGVDDLSIFGASWIDPAPMLKRGRPVPAAMLVGGVKEPPDTHGRPAGGREPLVLHER